MKEVTGPIIATTAVLMAVFVPVAFLPGVTGRLYNQFALTIAISVAISAFNSLTLSPALSAVLLRHRPRLALLPLPRLQCRVLARGRGLCAGRPVGDRGTVGRACPVRRRAGDHLWTLLAYPGGIPAGRGPGLFLRGHPTARWRIAAADRAGGGAGAGDSDRAAWGAGCGAGHRRELLDRRQSVELRGGIRHPEAVE